MSTRVWLLAAVSGALLGTAGVAHAQEAGEVHVVEGPGYPIGEGTVVHPILGAEAGFTDNVFSAYRQSQRHASGILRLVAEAAIASKDIEQAPTEAELDESLREDEAAPAAPAVQFRGSGRLEYYEFLSGDGVVRSQRDLAADLNGNLQIAPQGTFTFIAKDHFVRNTRPTNFYSSEGTNRIANNLGLALMYQPGGRTMKGGIRWENQIDFFEDSDQQFANRMINAFHGTYEWQLFPYTKLYADASYGFISSMGDGGAIPSIKRSASPIRGGAGIATAITELFTVKAHVGWAYASYAGGTGYNSPVFGTEVGYRYSPVGRLVAEYQWDHRDSLIGDYYRDHMFGVRVDQNISRIVGSATAEVRLRHYDGIVMDIGDPARDDLIFAVGAKASYVFKDWLAGVAEWRTEVDQTDYQGRFGGDVYDPSYTRTEITAGVRAAL
ncbi:MAG: hypothetical protein F9K40_09305 [Kofleriaceae bacterium]|nr:MAG: hypothetical protein F9K40_09305 [Kofleriaceae bacterium]